jgi:hypothetical protein
MARSDGRRVQVSVYFLPDEHRALKMYCTTQGLMMGRFLHDLAIDKLTEEGFYNQIKTLAVLVQENMTLLKETFSSDVLDAIAAGKKPEEIDIFKIAVALNIPQDKLEAILRISFKNGTEKKEGVGNGV